MSSPRNGRKEVTEGSPDLTGSASADKVRCQNGRRGIAKLVGATLHPWGVNENKVNAFNPYYLTLEERPSSVSGGRKARNQNSE